MSSQPGPASARRTRGPRSVLVVVFGQVQSLDVTGPLEALAHARDAGGEPAYGVRTASLHGEPVRTTSGLLTSRWRSSRTTSAGRRP